MWPGRLIRSSIGYAHNGMCQPTFTSSWDGPKKQGGDDVDNVIADAMVKGVKGSIRSGRMN